MDKKRGPKPKRDRIEVLEKVLQGAYEALEEGLEFDAEIGEDDVNFLIEKASYARGLLEGSLLILKQ